MNTNVSHPGPILPGRWRRFLRQTVYGRGEVAVVDLEDLVWNRLYDLLQEFPLRKPRRCAVEQDEPDGAFGILGGERHQCEDNRVRRAPRSARRR